MRAVLLGGLFGNTWYCVGSETSTICNVELVPGQTTWVMLSLAYDEKSYVSFYFVRVFFACTIDDYDVIAVYRKEHGIEGKMYRNMLELAIV